MSSKLFFDGVRTKPSDGDRQPDASRGRFETMLIWSYEDMRNKRGTNADRSSRGEPTPAPAH